MNNTLDDGRVTEAISTFLDIINENEEGMRQRKIPLGSGIDMQNCQAEISLGRYTGFVPIPRNHTREDKFAQQRIS